MSVTSVNETSRKGLFGYGIFKETLVVSIPATLITGLLCGGMAALMVGPSVVMTMHEVWQIKISENMTEAEEKKARKDQLYNDCGLALASAMASAFIPVFASNFSETACLVRTSLTCTLNRAAIRLFPLGVPLSVAFGAYKFYKYLR